jgi:hypothetical protein
VIDLRNTDDEALVEQIAQACRVYGFFQVTNHGVEGIDHFRDVCKSWFTSDKPKKRRNGTNARGYFDDELTKQVWKGSISIQTQTNAQNHKQTKHIQIERREREKGGGGGSILENGGFLLTQVSAEARLEAGAGCRHAREQGLERARQRSIQRLPGRVEPIS